MARTLAVASGFLGLVAVLAATTDLPDWVFLVYVAVSVVAFLTYGADKAAAVRGRRRTPESTLHALSLAGGWPGALVARQHYRHKTVKQPFRAVFWSTVVLNCGLLVWLVVAEPLSLL